jgi:archaellum component FlaC
VQTVKHHEELELRDSTIVELKQELANLTHDFTALGEQYMELLDLLKEKDDLLRQIAAGLECK